MQILKVLIVIALLTGCSYQKTIQTDINDDYTHSQNHRVYKKVSKVGYKLGYGFGLVLKGKKKAVLLYTWRF